MSNIDTIREALKQAEKIIGKQPGLTSSALAALDRLQAQQPNAEPVDMIHNDYDASVKCSNCGTDGGFGVYDDLDWAKFCPGCGRPIARQIDAKGNVTPHPLYAHPPASTEPPSYVYSRDYEALYDLLMRGGEAIVIEQWPNGEQARRLNRRYLFGRSDAEPDTTKEFAINLWRRLDLEWIAPSTEPRLTVEQALPYLQHKKGCNMLSFTNSMMSHAPISQRLCDCGLDELRSSLTKAAKP